MNDTTTPTPRRSAGVALDRDDARFDGPDADGATGAARASEPNRRSSIDLRPWQSDFHDRPQAQVNARLTTSLADRLTAAVSAVLETGDEDAVEAARSTRDVYSKNDALNMAILMWVETVEEDLNGGRPFRAPKRRRRSDA